MSVAGRELELDRNCRNILALLVREANTPVEKERLLSEGWPGRLVHENSLAKAIGRLRTALNGTGLRIVAVYGIGYRLESEQIFRGTKDGADIEVLISLFDKAEIADPPDADFI